jgi:hypothetical protein
MWIKIKLIASVFVLIVNPFCFALASPEEPFDEYISSCKKFANDNLGPSKALGQDEFLQHIPMSIVCSQPEILSKLEGYERERIHAFKKRFEEAKKDYPQEELNTIEEISHYTLAMWEEEIGKSRIYTGKELSSLDIKLRSLWSEMLAALQAKDVDRAVRYYSHETRETYRELFASQMDVLPEIAEGLSDIQLIKMRSPHDVEYDIRSVENGVTYSNILIFVKDVDGEWRILKY